MIPSGNMVYLKVAGDVPYMYPGEEHHAPQTRTARAGSLVAGGPLRPALQPHRPTLGELWLPRAILRREQAVLCRITRIRGNTMSLQGALSLDPWGRPRFTAILATPLTAMNYALSSGVFSTWSPRISSSRLPWRASNPAS